MPIRWRNVMILAIGVTSLAAEPVPSPSPAPVASPTSALAPVARVRLHGQVREKGTRAPLASVNVFVLPHQIKTLTDATGHFEVEVPEGDFYWVVNVAGYRKLEQDDEASAETADRARRLSMEKKFEEVFETTVFGREEARDDRTRSMKAEKLAALPGSGGDPIKGVQNLPGVARSPAFISQVIIEGSAPEDTRYHINGHEVPLIFHFGGLTSVVMPEALDRIDYLSAGYGPEFGRGLGGVVGAWTRSPRRDRWHGTAFVDLINAGAMVEGPTGEDSGFYATARQSYIGQLFALFFKGNADFDLTVAPTYSDASVVWEKDVSAQDRFTLASIGSIDTMEFVLSSPVRSAAFRGRFYNRTAFFRLMPEWTHRFDPATTSRYTLGIGRDWFRLDIGENYAATRNYEVDGMAELERRFVPDWTGFFGVSAHYIHFDYDFLFPRVVQTGTGNGISLSTQEKLKANVQVDSVVPALYTRQEWKVGGGPLTLIPGARLEYFNLTRETLPQPRAAARYQLTPQLRLRTAGGRYAELPQPNEIDPVMGNPDLKTEKAWHWTLGAEQDFRGGTSRGFVVSSDFFFKPMSQLVVSSSRLVTRDGVLTPENFSNEGTGLAYGLSSMIRLDAHPFNGWISYTLSRSTRTEPDRAEHLFQYDQSHILSVLGSVVLIDNWTLGARARLVSGNPTTPILGGIWDSDSDRYRPETGPFYSERLSPFFSLDVRLDRKWVFENWILSAYLDIQNATNHKNREAVRYSYDYSQKEEIAGLPILPTLGVKGEF